VQIHSYSRECKVEFAPGYHNHALKSASGAIASQLPFPFETPTGLGQHRPVFEQVADCIPESQPKGRGSLAQPVDIDRREPFVGERTGVLSGHHDAIAPECARVP
jgi:hypothetical protein